MGVDLLDVLNAHGPEAVRRVLDGAETIGEDLDVVSSEPLTLARRVLRDLFTPGEEFAHARWTLARFAESWWVYEAGAVREHGGGTRWRRVEDERLRAIVQAHLDGLRTYTRRLAKDADGNNKLDDEGKPVYQTARLKVTRSLLSDVVEAMRVDTMLAIEEAPAWVAPTFTREGRPRWLRTGRRRVDRILFEDDGEAPIRAADVIAFPNSLLDGAALGDRGEVVLRAHTPRWFSSACLAFDLDVERLRGLMEALVGAEDEADAWEVERTVCAELCPAWMGFLEQVSRGDGAWVACLQTWFGYCLSSDRRLHKVLVMPGPPGSGKGTITRVLGGVLGEEGVAQTSLKTLGDNRFALSQYVDKQLLVLPDASVSRQTDAIYAVEVIKSLSGGDRQTIEAKNRNLETNVRPRCKIMIVANEQLKLPDPSGSLARRFVVLPTFESFEDRDDVTLGDRLERELPGVMLWALVGHWRLRQAGGFVAPESGASMLEEMRQANAPVYGFVQEWCVVGPGQSVRCDVLRGAFTAWAAEQGHEGLARMAASTFGQQLGAAMPMVRRARRSRMEEVDGGAWAYEGLRPLKRGEDRDAASEVMYVNDQWSLPDELQGDEARAQPGFQA